MTDAEDDISWLLDTLLDLHDRAKGLIGNPKFFILWTRAHSSLPPSTLKSRAMLTC
jgi:hypothetical protein